MVALVFAPKLKLLKTWADNLANYVLASYNFKSILNVKWSCAVYITYGYMNIRWHSTNKYFIKMLSFITDFMYVNRTIMTITHVTKLGTSLNTINVEIQQLNVPIRPS